MSLEGASKTVWWIPIITAAIIGLGGWALAQTVTSSIDVVEVRGAVEANTACCKRNREDMQIMKKEWREDQKMILQLLREKDK